LPPSILDEEPVIAYGIPKGKTVANVAAANEVRQEEVAEEVAIEQQQEAQLAAAQADAAANNGC
jgi:hypothetical protein